MAITPITIYTVPFQSKLDLTTSLAAATAATTTMSFINDGYTVLFIRSAMGATPTVTISSAPDNSGRVGSISEQITANSTVSYGPFRPIWWNVGGLVSVGLSASANITLCCFKYQF